jgi:hypothetical protein
MAPSPHRDPAVVKTKCTIHSELSFYGSEHITPSDFYEEVHALQANGSIEVCIKSDT